MKISLFIKSYTRKVVSVVFILTIFFLTSFPVSVKASFFDSISNLTSGLTAMVLGSEVVADEKDVLSNKEENTTNSQNMDLSISSESCVNPDLIAVNSSTDLFAVQSDSFIYNEGSYVPDVKFEKSPISDQIRIYTVEEGDTLSEIAETFDVSVNTIRWENKISGNTISIGKKLNILPVTGVKHIVVSGDTLSKIASKYDALKEDILIFNDLTNDSLLKKGDVIFVPNGIIKQAVVKSSGSSSYKGISSSTITSGYYIRPTTGPITSPYGPRKGSYHYGIDIGNVRGTPIVASASGTVVQFISYCKEGVSSCGGRYGNYITIQHENGQRTRYAHLQKINVSVVGQYIKQGEKIGTMGNTGRSTGPHLHFEIIKSNGSTIRPVF